MLRKKILFCTLISLILTLNLLASTAAEKYHKGMEYFDRGKYGKSIKIFKKLLKKHDNTTDLGRVVVQIGLAYEKMEKYKKAFEAYEMMFQKYPEYNNPEEIVSREFEIAKRYLEGNGKKVLGIDFAESDKMALKILNAVVRNSPFGKHATEALLESIKLHQKIKEFEKAEKKLRVFRQTYENSPLLDDVYFLEAENHYLQSQRSNYDQSHTESAIEKFKEYQQKYPLGKHFLESDEKLQEMKSRKANQLYDTAIFYLDHSNFEASRNYANSIIDLNPPQEWVEKANALISKIPEHGDQHEETKNI